MIEDNELDQLDVTLARIQELLANEPEIELPAMPEPPIPIELYATVELEELRWQERMRRIGEYCRSRAEQRKALRQARN